MQRLCSEQEQRNRLNENEKEKFATSQTTAQMPLIDKANARRQAAVSFRNRCEWF